MPTIHVLMHGLGVSWSLDLPLVQVGGVWGVVWERGFYRITSTIDNPTHMHKCTFSHRLPADELPFCNPMCGGCTLYQSAADVAACQDDTPSDWNGKCAHGAHYAGRDTR